MIDELKVSGETPGGTTVTDEALTPKAPLFRQRLAGCIATLPGYPGVAFHLRAVTASERQWLMARDPNGDLHRQAMLKFGLVKVEGLTDEDGREVDVEVNRESVVIWGQTKTPLTTEFIDRLDVMLQNALSDKVIELTNLAVNEKLRVDFT